MFVLYLLEVKSKLNVLKLCKEDQAAKGGLIYSSDYFVENL